MTVLYGNDQTLSTEACTVRLPVFQGDGVNAATQAYDKAKRRYPVHTVTIEGRTDGSWTVTMMVPSLHPVDAARENMG